MPSEKQKKKLQASSKSSGSADQLKPLAHYVDDRLELTKQLFSCLKNDQIKQRLPANLQNKSIERIQQICLDEILGISTKRLVSIINSTECPENTDSDDSEIEQLEEHISLEEISSDSDATPSKAKVTVQPKKVDNSKATKKVKEEKTKSPKEMTMLELLELQARARAIRSQLALEPVTKIELDSDDDDEEEASTSNNSNKKSKEKSSESAKKPDVHTKATLKKVSEFINLKAPPPPPAKPKPSAKPLKLKRNYKNRDTEASPSTPTVTKEPTPPLEENANDNDSRSSSPDVITMDPSIETYFISDSDEEPAKKKKSPERKEMSPVKPDVLKSPSKENSPEEDLPPEEGKIRDSTSREISPEPEKVDQLADVPNVSLEKEQTEDIGNEDETANNDDENVVHLMSDTEIDLHHHSDKEDNEPEIATTVKQAAEPEKVKAKIPDPVAKMQSDDDDVVEIHNSSDDELMNESDKSTGESSAKNSQTWEQRWLSSSKTQNILKTTQLASKVRVNMLKTKKSQKANEKNKAESEKSMKEKVKNAEEGSLEQFIVSKESSN